VLSVGEVEFGELVATQGTPLFGVDWVPVTAEPTASELVVLPVGDGPVEQVVGDVLEILQAALADDTSRFAVVTRGATTGENLAASAVWGLVRSAQSENPGRIVLVDGDDETLMARVPALLDAGETQLRITDGTIHAARLAVLPRSTVDTTAWDPERTVLVTGGTGGLGGMLARHLVTAHGMRRLVLVSRRGEDAPGARELRDDLTALGAEVVVEACDVADRDAVAALVDGVDLTAVVHTAGVLDDGVLGSLTRDRVTAVLAPKALAAQHLHDLAGNLDGFVLYSSVSAAMGTPGQANYAAANAYLDALAAHRHARGLPAVSLAWGPWAQDSGMTGTLTDEQRDRMTRNGLPPLSPEDGLALFDAAVAHGAPYVFAAKLGGGGQAPAGVEIPALMRGLVRGGRRQAAAATEASGLVDRLATLDEQGRVKLLVTLVRDSAAAVLGHATTDTIGQDKEFRQVGFDSLTAVELRNRLGAATGVTLPATLVFDYPTPRALADYLAAELLGEATAAAGTALFADLDRIEAAVAGADETTKAGLAGRLRTLLAALSAPAEPEDTAAKLSAASAAEVLAFIDNELGRRQER
jgi:acyl carrier protein